MEKVYRGRVGKISKFKALSLTFILPILLAACSAGTGGYTASTGGSSPTPPPSGGGSTPPQDTTPPSINITAPTTASSYDTTNGSVTVSGTATDNVGLTRISWANNKGGSGSQTVSGTSANASFNIALQNGANTITLTAIDTSGNSGQKQLVVNYTAPTSNSATLTWDPVNAATLAGYRIYYGTASGSYQQARGQGISVGNVVTYKILGLSSATRYYFSVVAVDSQGTESPYSNEAFKDIP
jgi:fibronectin type 3 domain-containing protein